MPARAASRAVLDTVVAPLSPVAAATGRSRTPSLARSGSAHTRSTWSGVRPTCGTPSSTAIVAGTAPPARTAASISSAAARLSGRGRPWASRVLSSATTGRRAASAFDTSGERTAADGVGAEVTLSSWLTVHPQPTREHAVTSSTDILERPDVRDADTDQPPEMFHYVRKNKIAESAVMGTLVEALCGEVFPVTKTAKPGSPVCPRCKEIYESLRK